MHNLRPAILEQGLVAALQWMASRSERRTGIACRFTSNRETVALPAGVPLVAYRTAQEALTNVSKHAQASQVAIELTVAAGTLTSRSPTTAAACRARTRPRRARSGSAGCERAGTVGGWVDLSSSGRGTTLILLGAAVVRGGPRRRPAAPNSPPRTTNTIRATGATCDPSDPSATTTR